MPRANEMTEQELNIKFVKEVEKHPALYNYELPSYSRKDTIDQAWESVGNAVNMTPSSCKEKWRNLRAVFVRNYKAPINGTAKKKPYYLADDMQFIVPFLKPAVTIEVNRAQRASEVPRPIEVENDEPFVMEIEQIKVEQVDDDSNDWNSQIIEDSRRKRPVQDTEDSHPNKKQLSATPATSVTIGGNDQHIKSFLDSLVPELTEMNTSQFKNFKRRVLVLIDDIMSD